MSNSQCSRKLQLNEQICGTCDMRAYVAAVVVELPRGYSSETVEALDAIVGFANRSLSRLFKAEHYLHRHVGDGSHHWPDADHDGEHG